MADLPKLVALAIVVLSTTAACQPKPKTPGRTAATAPAPTVLEASPKLPTRGIGGSVSTDGAALAGAQVCAWVEGSRSRRVRDEIMTARCVETDESGRYTLPLEPGVWFVVASAPEHLARGSSAVLRASSPNAPVDFSLSRGGRAYVGRLTDPAGAPIADARVDAMTWLGSRVWIGASATTDARGDYALWAGDQAHLLGSAPGFAGPMIQQSGETYVLLPASTIAGRVVDERGQAVPGARVGFSASLGANYGEPDNATRANANGEFRLEGLLPGRYELIALSDAGFGSRDEVQVGYAQSSTAEVSIEIDRPVHPLRLQLVEPGGEPIAQCRVQLGREDGERRFRRTVAWSDQEGLIEELVPAGRYEITATSCPGQAGNWAGAPPYEPIVVRDADPQTIRVEVVHGGAVHGRLLTPSGQPIVGETLHLSGQLDYIHTTSATTDDRGQFEITGLPPGTYVLSGWEELTDATSFEIADSQTTKLTVTIPATGRVEARATVQAATEAASRLELRVIDAQGQPAPGAVVHVDRWGSQPPAELDWSAAVAQDFAITDTEGRASVEFVPGPDAASMVAVRPGELGLSVGFSMGSRSGELVIELQPDRGH